MGSGTKSRLEELQAEIKLRTGKKVTPQEVLERLVNRASGSESEFVDSFREQRLPLSEDEKEAFFSGTTASGKETDEEDIDEILYG